MSPALLSARGLEAGYGRLPPAIRGVDLELEAGTIVALVGPNGAGKSTLIRALAGLTPLRAGELLLCGEPITAWPAHRRAAAGIATIPEGRALFLSLTVEENLRLGASRIGAPALTRRLHAVQADFPRLAARMTQLAGTLSGGEQQALALARALMSEPRVLLLDEPSLGLSPEARRELAARLGALRARGLAILIAEESPTELADHTLLLEAGAPPMFASRLAPQGAQS